MKRQLLFFVILCTSFFAQAQCVTPGSMVAYNVNQESLILSWTANGDEIQWEIIALPQGSPAPTAAESGVIAPVNPFTFTGLDCETVYDFYLRAVCSESENSAWTPAFTLTMASCLNSTIGELTACDTNGDGIETFNLSMQDESILADLPEGDYTLTYHLTPEDAHGDVNQLPSVYTSTVFEQMIFIRAENNANGNYELFSFPIIVWDLPVAESIPPQQACDDNGDGFAEFDLDALTQQIYEINDETTDTWFVTYHQTQLDAELMIDPISDTSSYTNTTVGSQYVYARMENWTFTGCAAVRPVLLQVVNCVGISMTAFLDLDANGTKGAGEPLFPAGEFIYNLNDGEPHIIQTDGHFKILDENTANSYDISYAVAEEYLADYTVSPASYNDIAITGNGLQDYYFPVTAGETFNDLAVYVVPITSPRPGFTYVNSITYINYGNTVMSGNLTFTKDALVTITNVSQSGIVSNTDGFSYAFTDLQPFEQRTIDVTMQVPTIPTVSLGNQLVNSAAIGSSGTDENPVDNNSELSQTIIGSYDPNDKAEAHGGKIVFSDFTSEDYLYYTIRFENSGTAEAFNVRIEDLLDSQLDPETVRTISTSHPYTMERDGSQLTWRFDNIMLPPTTEDPIGSHGYVHFKVKPNTGFALGDVIPNTASIFFDFNPAIITNTFETQFVTSLSIGDINAAKFTIYPNPADAVVTINANDGFTFTKATIIDMTGKVILSKSISAASATSVDVSDIASGLYLIQIEGENSKSVSKLIIR